MSCRVQCPRRWLPELPLRPEERPDERLGALRTDPLRDGDGARRTDPLDREGALRPFDALPEKRLAERLGARRTDPLRDERPEE